MFLMNEFIVGFFFFFDACFTSKITLLKNISCDNTAGHFGPQIKIILNTCIS